VAIATHVVGPFSVNGIPFEFSTADDASSQNRRGIDVLDYVRWYHALSLRAKPAGEAGHGEATGALTCGFIAIEIRPLTLYAASPLSASYHKLKVSSSTYHRKMSRYHSADHYSTRNDGNADGCGDIPYLGYHPCAPVGFQIVSGFGFGGCGVGFGFGPIISSSFY